MSIKQKIKLWWNGIRNDESRFIETARSLYSIFDATPELARRMFDLLPAIIIEMKRLERALPQSGKGQERLGQLVDWMKEEHASGLENIAKMNEVVMVTRALATIIISFLKATGMMR